MIDKNIEITLTVPTSASVYEQILNEELGYTKYYSSLFKKYIKIYEESSKLDSSVNNKVNEYYQLLDEIKQRLLLMNIHVNYDDYIFKNENLPLFDPVPGVEKLSFNEIVEKARYGNYDLYELIIELIEMKQYLSDLIKNKGLINDLIVNLKNFHTLSLYSQIKDQKFFKEIITLAISDIFNEQFPIKQESLDFPVDDIRIIPTALVNKYPWIQIIQNNYNFYDKYHRSNIWHEYSAIKANIGNRICNVLLRYSPTKYRSYLGEECLNISKSLEKIEKLIY